MSVNPNVFPFAFPESGEGLSLCDQKGSLVDAEKLRFDFSWSGALTPEQIASVESIVNQKIQSALPVHAQLVSLADATKITALRQVFGERYPDPVSKYFYSELPRFIDRLIFFEALTCSLLKWLVHLSFCHSFSLIYFHHCRSA